MPPPVAKFSSKMEGSLTSIFLVFLASGFAAIAPNTFRCPSDGLFADENDSTKFYYCINGRSNPGYCPSGLLWDNVDQQWVVQSDCYFTPAKETKLGDVSMTSGHEIYLTFDDGPTLGTTQVLDSLKKYGVKATFFITSNNFSPDHTHAINTNNLARMVNEGHVLADHSYDHMYHNDQGDGPNNVYLDVDNDLQYFGRRNAEPVLKILLKAGLDQKTINYVNYTMNTFVRMPYSNNWRVRTQEGRRIEHDCYECTSPGNSGSNGVKIANSLEQSGAQVIGWDLEWKMNFTINRLLYGGHKMFQRLGTVQNAQSQGKVVVLCHDYAFRPQEITGTAKAALELDILLEKATESGYQFKTVDTYPYD